MENRARIAMEANRRIVQEGLNRRKLENELEDFEATMIQHVNDNCARAILEKRMDDTIRDDKELRCSKVQSREERREAARRIRNDTALGCLIFLVFAAFMLWLTTWTYLPLAAAIACIAGGAMFLAIEICRLRGVLPTEDGK